MKFSVGRPINGGWMKKYICFTDCVRGRMWQGEAGSCADKHHMEGLSSYLQVGSAKGFLVSVEPMWHCLLMGRNSHGYPQLVPGRSSASLASRSPTPLRPSLPYARRWNQPERLPLLSELLWELVVLKSCDWLCGNLLASPSATR